MNSVKQKLISVVVPNYNGGIFLEESLRSILQQSYQHFELIVVDDHSTDESWNILNTLAEEDMRVRIFQNHENLGIPQTRNRLFRELSEESEYVAILDSDDVMEPERLQRQLAYLETHPNVSAVGSWVTLIDTVGKEMGTRRYPTSSEDIRNSLLSVNPIAQPSIMLRTSVVKEIGKYDEMLQRVQDLDYWARILRSGHTIENIPEALTRYRVHKKGGQFGRDRKSLWFGFLVRAKHILHPRLFTFRALISTGGYFAATVLPPRVVGAVARRFFRDYDTSQ